MRKICNGCGGYVGIDCFNPMECEWIAQRQEAQRHQDTHDKISRLERRIKELEDERSNGTNANHGDRHSGWSV